MTVEMVQAEPLAEDWTPEKLFRELHQETGFFWLDSAGGVPELSRYSIIGCHPFARLTLRSGTLWIDGKPEVFSDREGVLARIGAILEKYNRKGNDSLPFFGGWVGYFGYEFGGYFEDLPQAPTDDLQLPEMDLAAYDGAYVFDHHQGQAWVTGSGANEPSGSTIERLRTLLSKDSGKTIRGGGTLPSVSFLSNLEPQAYQHRVERIREYIASGDIYQVNLAHRFQGLFDGQSAELYLRLRRINPAPFAAFLRTSDAEILSCSPERFLRWVDNRIESRPIKGTRPRMAIPSEDRLAAEALVRDPKERAELLMIVDLIRNDLGRIACPGSVQVTKLHHLESYATVHHLIGEVQAELPQSYQALEILRATFPGGSVTGAPKIRAMQLIAELESHRRDVFTGAIGYISFHGTADLSIAIRTLVRNRDQLAFHVGSGIVWDSIPEQEYQETLHKARGVFNAFDPSLSTS